MGVYDYSTPTYGSAKPVKSKPAKKGKSFGGFVSNFAGGVGDALVGLATSPYYISKAGFSDIKDALDGGGYSSELAKMGRGAWGGMKQYYSPLVHGEFGKFGRNVYNNPFQIVLDATTLATAGAAGAGAVGARVAASASAGSRSAALGARIAGLERAGAYAALPASLKPLATSIENGAASLIPRARVVTAGGKVLHTMDKRVARNPLVRARNEMVAKGLEKLPTRALQDAGATNRALSYFHPSERGPRLEKAKMDRIARTQAKRDAGDVAMMEAKLSPAQQDALPYYVEGFRSSDDLLALLSSREKTLAEVKARSKYKGQSRDVLNLKKSIDTLTDPDVQKALLEDQDVAFVGSKVIELSDKNQITRQARLGGEHDPRKRATEPRRAAGLDTPDDMPLGIISYSENRTPGARATKAGKRVDGEMKFDFDKESGEYAFKHAMYAPRRARKVVQQYAQEANGARQLSDFNYMLQVSEPFNPAKHGALINKGYELIDSKNPMLGDVKELSSWIQKNVVPVAEKVGNEDALATAKLLADWADEIDAGGQLVIPSSVVRQLKPQIAQGKNALRSILEKPTKVWRDATLSLKGSFYVNNFLGNLIMGFTAYGPEYLKEILTGGHTFRKGALNKQITKASGGAAHRGQLNVLREMGEESQPWMFGNANPLNWMHTMGDKFAEVGAKFTESNFRDAGAAIKVKADAKNLMKNQPGLKRADAINELLNDADYVDMMLEDVAGKMLDYTKLTPFEKNVMRTAYPFWNFMRAITGRTIQLALDEPWKIAVMSEMSKAATRENEATIFSDIEGKIPHYLKGLAATGPKDKDGKTPVLSLYAANPFSGAADVFNQVGSLASGELNASGQNPISSMNPFLKSGMEAVIGRDVFFDSPLQGSKTSIFGSQLLKQFPQYGFYDKARYPSSTSIVSRTGKQILGQYMGYSAGTYDPAMLARSQAINAYYEQLAKASVAKREQKREASDRGPLLGYGSSLRDKVGM